MKFAARQPNLRMSEIDTLDAAKRIGFDGVQLAITPNDYEQSPLWSLEDCQDIAAHADNVGIEVCSVCAGALNQIGLGAPAEETRAEARRITEKCVQASAELGCSNVLLAFFGKMAMNERDWQNRAIEEIRKLVPLAEELNVILAVECTLNAADTLRVVDACESDMVGVYFDMANALYYGYDPIEEAKALAPRIAEVHIKDGTPDAIVPLGEGVVDVAGVINTLSDCGYDGYYPFETTLKGDPEEALARDLAYVRELLGQ